MGAHPPLIQILRHPPETPAATSTSVWQPVVDRIRELGGSPAGDDRVAVSAGETCEFCGAAMDSDHQHLVNLATRSLLCICRTCHLLLAHDGAGGHRFRVVPDRYLRLSGTALGDSAWDALDIPIGLAFVFRSSTTDRLTAFYPSPAGATESELPLDAWAELVRECPGLASMAPDVEALIVRRHVAGPHPHASEQSGESDALIVPIDFCYELVGCIRHLWQGLQGGDEMWAEVEAAFAYARERAASSSSCAP